MFICFSGGRRFRGKRNMEFLFMLIVDNEVVLEILFDTPATIH